jgi:hypothetical protein
VKPHYRSTRPKSNPIHHPAGCRSLLGKLAAQLAFPRLTYTCYDTFKLPRDVSTISSTESCVCRARVPQWLIRARLRMRNMIRASRLAAAKDASIYGILLIPGNICVLYQLFCVQVCRPQEAGRCPKDWATKSGIDIIRYKVNLSGYRDCVIRFYYHRQQAVDLAGLIVTLNKMTASKRYREVTAKDRCNSIIHIAMDHTIVTTSVFMLSNSNSIPFSVGLFFLATLLVVFHTPPRKKD